MKKHKILDKKRLMNTTTIAMSLLVAAIMVSSSAMAAATSSNANNINIEVEEESRTVTRQPSLEVTDKNPNKLSKADKKKIIKDTTIKTRKEKDAERTP